MTTLPAHVIHGLFLSTLLAAATGCGPTRTPGTEGLPVDRLAQLHVPQHNGIYAWRHEKVHVAGVKIDDVGYPKRGDVDFLLAPGVHHVEVFYGACVHGPRAWFN